MSLTSFLAQPDVRAHFKEVFPQERVHLEPHPLIAPLTKHYPLVGTAFDYLLRFALQQRYAHAVAEPWIAEQATDELYSSLVRTIGGEKARMARQFVQKAKQCHAQYLLDGILTEDLLRSVLLVAQIDPFFRAGVLYEPFGEVDVQDIEDLRHLFAAIPFERLTSQSLCLLNPHFGASSLVGGADLDLLLNRTLIEVKTTIDFHLKREYINQLLGYYTLSLLGGVAGMPEDHAIREVGVYFARHGYLYTCPIERFAPEATFREFSAWFRNRARRGRAAPLQQASESASGGGAERKSPPDVQRPAVPDGEGYQRPTAFPLKPLFPHQETTSARKRLLLVDGFSLMQQANSAVSETHVTQNGEMVNIVLGFFWPLMRALRESRPDHLAVAFDRLSPTFRHQQFAPYRANHPFLPEQLLSQRSRIREITEAFGIAMYEKDGFEGDDILGTLARQATHLGLDTMILTADLDTLQLINAQVRIMVLTRGVTEATEYTSDDVLKSFGVPPAHIPDYQGLRGDRADNIPGIKGVSDKTAKKLLAAYDRAIENIFAHLDDLDSREQQLLLGKEQAALQNKYLATIVCDVPIQLDLEACRVGQMNLKRGAALFRELDLRALSTEALSLAR